MMVENVLQKLKENNIHCRIADNELKVKGQLNDEFRTLIRQHSKAIYQYLLDKTESYQSYLDSNPNTFYVYDVEVLPNLFSIIFMNVEDKTDVHIFEISDRKKDRDKIISFLNRDITLIGYNNQRYDDLILKGFIYHQNLYALSFRIIHNLPISNNLRFKPVRFNSIDLMKIGNTWKLGLKRIGIRLHAENIEDIPFNPEENINIEDIDTLLSYNLNDVKLTYELFHYHKPAIELRQELEKIYHIPLMVSNSQLGEKIFKSYYQSKTGLSDYDFRNMGTPRGTIEIKDCVSPRIYFESIECQNLLKEVLTWEVYPDNNYKKSDGIRFEFAGLKLDVKSGGLHSKDESGIFESNDEFKIIDIDVSSYYPFLITNFELFPSHLDGDIFLEVYSDLIDKRINAKKNEDEVISKGLKESLVSSYGQTKYLYSWLYDPKVSLSVAMNGQLLLILLAEKLHLAGIKILSVNTDGIFVYLDKAKEEEFKSVCQQWEHFLGFELESKIYDKYVRKDCNNYFMVKGDKVVKQKGIFLTDRGIEHKTEGKIVAKALVNYLAFSIPVEDTIKQSQNIFDFILSKNIDKKYLIQYGDRHLTRDTRFIAGLDGYEIYKFETENPDKTISMWKTVKVLEVNRIDKPFSHYRIDYDYYINECRKVIDEIEGKKEVKPEKKTISNNGNIKGVLNDSDEWYTPDYIIDKVKAVLGNIDLDPATSDLAQQTVKAKEYFTVKDNGLIQDWHGKVFLNPPYGKRNNQPKWSKKLEEEFLKGDVEEAILLVNANFGYKWFDHLFYSYPVCLVKGRIKFIPGNGQEATIAKRATGIVYLGDNVDKFEEVFSDLGKVIIPEDV